MLSETLIFYFQTLERQQKTRTEYARCQSTKPANCSQGKGGRKGRKLASVQFNAIRSYKDWQEQEQIKENYVREDK